MQEFEEGDRNFGSVAMECRDGGGMQAGCLGRSKWRHRTKHRSGRIPRGRRKAKDVGGGTSSTT